MKLVERYIMRRAFVVFAAALFWTLAIVWTTQVLARIDLVTSSGQSFLAFFELATLILPSIAPAVIPFAIAIGVSQTLTMMNVDSELVVIGASGSSRLAVSRPLLLLALIASLSSFIIDNTLDPLARQRARELVAAARADLLSSVIQEGTFRKVDDGLYVQIGERLADGRIGEIFVADSREEGIDLAYYAKSGAVAHRDGRNVLLMRDGVVHRKPVGGEVSIIRFSSYAFDLSLFAAEEGAVTMYPKDRTLPYLFNPDPNDYQYKLNPQQFRAEIHRRFAEWIYPFVFALIAVAVAGDARSHREARIHPMLTVLTLAVIVRWLGYFAANETQNNVWFAPMVYAVPLVTTAICVRFIISNRTMELPTSLTERVTNSGRWLAERVSIGRRSEPAQGGA